MSSSAREVEKCPGSAAKSCGNHGQRGYLLHICYPQYIHDFFHGRLRCVNRGFHQLHFTCCGGGTRQLLTALRDARLFTLDASCVARILPTVCMRERQTMRESRTRQLSNSIPGRQREGEGCGTSITSRNKSKNNATHDSVSRISGPDVDVPRVRVSE